MAHAILTGLKAPAKVSDVAIDVQSSKVDVNGCKVEVTSVFPNHAGVSFTRTDEALPMPIQKDWLPMLPYTNELNDLNWYGLAVKGLKEGTYTIGIDGVAVGKFSTKDLDAGVNLGNLTSGPIFDQGSKVLQAINEKNRIVYGRFRGILLGGDSYWNTAPGQKRRAEELARRREEIDAAQAEVYKLAKPVPHKFEVKLAE